MCIKKYNDLNEEEKFDTFKACKSHSMKYLFILLFLITVSACAPKEGEVAPASLSVQDKVNLLMSPLKGKYWVWASKHIGDDYSVVYSPTEEKYGLSYNRFGIVLIVVLKADGTVQTWNIGQLDFEVL